MDLDKARQIYKHPKGYSKQECRDCIQTLNEACQPVKLNNLQFVALMDAQARLNPMVINRAEELK